MQPLNMEIVLSLLKPIQNHNHCYAKSYVKYIVQTRGSLHVGSM